MVGSYALSKYASHVTPNLVSDFAGLNPSWYSNLFPGCILHVCTHALPEFIKFLPQINVPFKLLTNNSDFTIPDHFKETHVILENPFLIKWFAQNCILSHEKLVKIPIGLDYHTLRPSKKKMIWQSREKHSWGFKKYATEQEAELLSFNKTPFWNRQVKAYSNFQFLMGTRYGFDRKNALEKISKDLVFYEPMKTTRDVCWNNMSKYTFVISPWGNGLDCHRTWEALCIGCIPIVKTSGLDSLFDDLPVWIVNDWLEVNQENMIKKVEEFKEKTFNYEKLTMAYWRNILTQ